MRHAVLSACPLCSSCLGSCPDCAVCSNGFSPGTAHSCHSCAGKRSPAAHGIFFSVLVVASALVVLVVMDLLSLVNGSEDLGDKMKGSGWGSIVFRLTGAVPLACFKVVVVIWQIISQVRAVNFPRHTLCLLYCI